jgi:hypothetical protein
VVGGAGAGVVGVCCALAGAAANIIANRSPRNVKTKGLLFMVPSSSNYETKIIPKGVESSNLELQKPKKASDDGSKRLLQNELWHSRYLAKSETYRISKEYCDNLWISASA